MDSKSKPTYCKDKNFLTSLKGGIARFSPEQKSSFFAMYELNCFHNDLYGINETFLLEDENHQSESVTMLKTIGSGGSKKAILLDDGKVIMMPNMDVDFFGPAARWWPECVDRETAMAKFLHSINVPALNRSKGYLTLESIKNSGEAYKLPVFISDSFKEYASKGWFIIDAKDYSCNPLPKEVSNNFDLELKSWEKPLKPLIKDVITLFLNGIYVGTDSSNVVITNNNQELEFHYFGFDFGGKYGSISAPSKEVKFEDYEFTDESINRLCKDIKDQVESVLSSAYTILYENQDFDQVMNFTVKAFKHFASCDFIKETIYESIDLSNPFHEEL